ncbi:MAG TPA: MBL fold metallo-hydrolase [Steroidobacteraceae bacterium]|nr:MBL fold metallo-hydrolase [Steroidobacteraceae bacterium]
MPLKITVCVGALASLAVTLAAIAPYIGAEYLLRQHGAIIGPQPSQPVRGRWFDDYFLVQPLDANTYAIGEPRYYQGNYSYLLVGRERALLFDAGTGQRDIVPVVRSLTSLPVTVLPSHLHFDHVGSLGRFERTALLDLAPLRMRIRHDRLTLGRYEFLGFADSQAEPSFTVNEWWVPGSAIDLGGRTVRVLSTPGHTATSAALYDTEAHLLFAGDFIYPGELYAFLPGASRGEYLATTRQLLATLDPATRIYAAHMADNADTIAAPLLEIADLRALEQTLLAGHNNDILFPVRYPRIYPVRGPITFATGYAWNNR